MKGEVIQLGASSETKNVAMVSRGVSVLDFFLRVIAIVATLASAIAMATTNETLPFATRFIRFRARFSDLPSLTFFVAANSVVCGYLILSLVLSIFHIVRSNKTQGTRVVLMFLDTGMMALLTSGASAAAAIVYLAHKGNTKTNWFSFCRQFNSFCDRISGALIGSFGGVVIFVVLILLSATALARR